MRTVALFFRTLSAALLVIFLAGCVMSFTGEAGSGTVVTFDSDVSGFRGVSAGSGCKLTVVQGEGYSVVVRVDDNFRDRVRVEKDGSTLRLGLKGWGFGRKTFEVDVTMPELEGLSLSGGSRGDVQGFESEQSREMSLSGGSRLTGALNSGDLAISMSGGARAELSGRGADLSIDGSGGASADLSDFRAASAEVSLSGGSSAHVNLDGELRGGVSGGAAVYYSGNPSRIDVSKSGGGRVVQR